MLLYCTCLDKTRRDSFILYNFVEVVAFPSCLLPGIPGLALAERRAPRRDGPAKTSAFAGYRGVGEREHALGTNSGEEELGVGEEERGVGEEERGVGEEERRGSLLKFPGSQYSTYRL